MPRRNCNRHCQQARLSDRAPAPRSGRGCRTPNTAPALSSVPSMPSVSPAIAAMCGCPSNATASASRNSALRPPRPPPPNSDGGLASGQKHARWRGGVPHVPCTSARSPPSRALPRGPPPQSRRRAAQDIRPRRAPWAAAASSASWGREIVTSRVPWKQSSPGFGVSELGSARTASMCGAKVMRYFANTALASARGGRIGHGRDPRRSRPDRPLARRRSLAS